jgi:hypothetical protein
MYCEADKFLELFWQVLLALSISHQYCLIKAEL